MTFSFRFEHLLFAGVAALCLGLCAVARPAVAQSGEDGSVTVGAGQALQMGGLIQADALLGRENSADGFRARSARLRLGGQAERLSYVIQTDFTASSVLLDAFVQLPLANRVRLRGGLFKTPYSAEILRSRPRIRFAERARVVNALSPARQAGLQLVGDLMSTGSEAQVTATVGAFNGTRGLIPNDNDDFLYVGRLDGSFPLGPGALDVGASAGYSIDDQVSVAEMSSFSGTRILGQVDAQYEVDRWLFAGEFHVADLERDLVIGSASQSPSGFHLTAGMDIAEEHQALVRLDQYDPDARAVPAPDERLVLGYNYEPSSLLRVQANYQAPTGNLGGGFFTGRLQVAF